MVIISLYCYCYSWAVEKLIDRTAPYGLNYNLLCRKNRHEIFSDISRCWTQATNLQFTCILSLQSRFLIERRTSNGHHDRIHPLSDLLVMHRPRPVRTGFLQDGRSPSSRSGQSPFSRKDTVQEEWTTLQNTEKPSFTRLILWEPSPSSRSRQSPSSRSGQSPSSRSGQSPSSRSGQSPSSRSELQTLNCNVISFILIHDSGSETTMLHI